MIVIGLTGGIATGKTTVTDSLAALGAPIADADEISRALTSPGGAALPLIRQRFGEEVFDEHNALIRPKLAAIVFSNPSERSALEEILHPIIITYTKEMLESFQSTGAHAAVLSAPLLIESSMHTLSDEVWVMYIPREEQIRRAAKRDGLTERQAAARLDSQSPFSLKARYADVIIPATGPMERTREMAVRQWERITR